jgi:O-methyltransferase
MFSLLKAAFKQIPPFSGLLSQRDRLYRQLIDAERRAADEARRADNAELRAEQRRRELVALEPDLNLIRQGNRFSSNMIHPALLRAEDWSFLDRGHDEEAVFKEWVRRIRPYTMVTYDGLASLADQVRYCEERDIPGCYVEAGTWKGGSAAMMALANLRYGRGRRRMYLFDSFCGIPEPDAGHDDMTWAVKDMYLKPEACRGRLRPTNCLVGPRADLEDVFFNVVGYPRECVDIAEGWFQDTVPQKAAVMGPVAILRLDGDLYDSIRVCLHHLYPLLVEGGFLVIDDWSLSGARKAVTEYFADQPSRPYMCLADATVRYFIKPQR